MNKTSDKETRYFFYQQRHANLRAHDGEVKKVSVPVLIIDT